MKSEVSQNQIAKLAMSFVLTACVLTQVSLPAFAQNYSLSAEQDSFLPPEVVPLDPQVAQKLAQSQAAARDMGGMNAGGMAANMNVSGDPMQNGNAGNATSQQTRQNIMDSMMNQGSFQNEAANQQVPGMVAPGGATNSGTSDWIMPGQDGNSASMAYGGVQQTQTLSAPPPVPTVRRDIRRAGMSNAVSAIAGFGAGAVLGSVLRRPSNMMGLGVTGLMLTGFGSRNAFRF